LNAAASYIHLNWTTTGAIINAGGIVLGGIGALAIRKRIPLRYELVLKVALGIYTCWFGLSLTWASLNGTWRQVLRELAIVLIAMTLGRMTGKLLGLQRMSNSVGQYANRILAAPAAARQSQDGFLLATALFCAGPLAVLASVQEGFTGFSPVFFVKAGTDGLATFSFCSTFGWGATASALPVLAFEGALIRLVRALEPFLRAQPWPLIDSINAVDGLLIFCVAMLILDMKKISVADYLPSLVFAPLLTRWLW
jgi:uncharacterized membrane protein YqgA involved in biofilm formation